MDPIASALPTISGPYLDGVAIAALSVVRRALIEGVPVTRDGLAHEASIALGEPSEDALRHIDEVAQRLGVSALSSNPIIP